MIFLRHIVERDLKRLRHLLRIVTFDKLILVLHNKMSHRHGIALSVPSSHTFDWSTIELNFGGLILIAAQYERCS